MDTRLYSYISFHLAEQCEGRPICNRPPTLHLADVYRDILLGVARTLTFTDPTKPTPTPGKPRACGAEAAMCNDFG